MFDFTFIFSIDAASCMFKTAIWLIVVIKNKIDDVWNTKTDKHALNIFVVESFNKLDENFKLSFLQVNSSSKTPHQVFDKLNKLKSTDYLIIRVFKVT